MSEPRSDSSIGSIGREEQLSDVQFSPSTPKVSSNRPSLAKVRTPTPHQKKTPVRTPRSTGRRVPNTPYARRAMEEATPRKQRHARDLRGELGDPLLQLRELSRTMHRERREEETRKQLNEERALTHLSKQVAPSNSSSQVPKHHVLGDLSKEHEEIVEEPRMTGILPEDDVPELEEQDDIPMELDSFADVGPPEVEEVEEAQRDQVPRMSLGGLSETEGNIAVPEGIIQQDGDFSMLDVDFEYDNRLSGSYATNVEDKTKSKRIGTSVTARLSPSQELGIPISSLRALARQTLSSKFLSQEALQRLSEIGMLFLEQQVEDLEAYAKHAGHKSIDHNDALLLMKRAKTRDTDGYSDPFCIASGFLSLDEMTFLENFMYKDKISRVAREKRRNLKKLAKAQLQTNDDE